jgi:hypothetical protein
MLVKHWTSAGMSAISVSATPRASRIAGGQTLVKYWSKTLGRRWSNTGQMLVKCWSTLVCPLSASADGRMQGKNWSNTGQTLVKRWSNAGQKRGRPDRCTNSRVGRSGAAPRAVGIRTAVFDQYLTSI